VYAVAAAAAGDVERHRHPVPDFDPGDAGADGLDDAHVLVAEDLALLDAGAAFVHVQVRSADVRRRDSNQGIGGCLDGRVGDLFDRDAERPLVDNGFHIDLQNG
jgi:hypothetical protein